VKKLARAIFFLPLQKKFKNLFFILVCFALGLSFERRAEAFFLVVPVQSKSILLNPLFNCSACNTSMREITASFQNFIFSKRAIPRLIFNQLNSAYTQFFKHPESVQNQLQSFERQFRCLKTIYQSV